MYEQRRLLDPDEGRAACLALDAAIGLMNKMELFFRRRDFLAGMCGRTLLHYHMNRLVSL